jgi:hypothetical protein
MSVPTSPTELSRVSARLLAPPAEKRSALAGIRVQCPLSSRERTGIECSNCERFGAWGLSPNGELFLACRLPCACCNPSELLVLDTLEVVFCDECRERAQAAEDECELGDGG